MNIVFYNPNSRGGNFDYALRLAKAYTDHPDIKQFHLVLPVNANIQSTENIHKILLSDQPAYRMKLLSRLYFLCRTFINPIKLFFFIRNREACVIFNDYDQVSSFLWSPLLKRLKKRLVFAVFLHDPDRDAYFSNVNISIFTMHKVMALMDIAFYHEWIPNKPYYQNTNALFISVPHGLYDKSALLDFDQQLLHKLLQFKDTGAKLLGALGNIRDEKNYPMILRTMKSIPGIKLFIAGLPASSAVDIPALKTIIKEQNLNDRVMILEKYLDDRELFTVAHMCDGFIMYYADTFKSQSGLLNLLAPYRKVLLVSSNESPLSKIVGHFQLGLMARADSQAELESMLLDFSENKVPPADWTGYFAYASWQNHVNIAVNALKKVRS